MRTYVWLTTNFHRYSLNYCNSQCNSLKFVRQLQTTMSKRLSIYNCKKKTISHLQQLHCGAKNCTLFIVCLLLCMDRIRIYLCVCVCVSVCLSHFLSTCQTSRRIFTVDSLTDADLRKDVPVGVSMMNNHIQGSKVPKTPILGA